METVLKNFYKNKKIFISGHSGFKGYWLTQSLIFFGAKVYCISDKVYNKYNFLNLKKNKHFKQSYRDLNLVNIKKILREFKPDLIFHLAAQSNLPLSYHSPYNTFKTNFNISLKLLESLKNINSNITSLFITSDKAYENMSLSRGYKEGDILGGKDPYSASKACTEIMINAYRESFNMRVATARAGNVIGGNDFSKYRIVPDCVSALNKKKSIEIRNRYATRPWQHVLDVINGYLLLNMYLYKDKKISGSWNFGPNVDNNKTVEILAEKIVEYWGTGNIKFIKNKIKEDKLLQLNANKAYKYLKWKVKYKFDKSVNVTVDWYKNYYRNKNKTDLISISQIEEYFG